MKTKTDKIRDFLRKGDVNSALKLYATFRIGISKEDKRVIEIAKDCITGKAAFYKALGINTEEYISKAFNIVSYKYKG